MYYIIDRIEENIVVCENIKTQKIENIGKRKLPTNIKQGLVIKFENGVYSIDEEETKKRKKIIHEKVKNLWK